MLSLSWFTLTFNTAAMESRKILFLFLTRQNKIAQTAKSQLIARTEGGLKKKIGSTTVPSFQTDVMPQKLSTSNFIAQSLKTLHPSIAGLSKVPAG